tara:strand:- start:42658 stop:43686 length:1029 start_codon:yes stop_codon:yes gene_type:complete
MADNRFFKISGPFILSELADRIGAEIHDPKDADRSFVDVSPLNTAGPEELSFLDNSKYVKDFIGTKAGGCIIHPSNIHRARPGLALLVTDNPYKSYALAAQAFYPLQKPKPQISEHALIQSNSSIGNECRIEAGAIISEGVKIGDRCHIESNAVISAYVEVGDDCFVGSCATLSYCMIGNRVRIYQGARIGQDGFGFSPAPDGHTKVPQLGRVIIEDDCEIGANTCVDRGSGPDTVIGQGTWLDNLIQIGHNVKIGRGCVMAGQSGISGSSEIGDFVFIGGQAAISGHIKIGDGAKIVGKSGIIRDIPPGLTFGGIPGVPVREWHRQTTMLSHLIKDGKKIK